MIEKGKLWLITFKYEVNLDIKEEVNQGVKNEVNKIKRYKGKIHLLQLIVYFIFPS